MAERILISSYQNSWDTKDIDVPFDDFLQGIKSGKWQDQVLTCRTIADKDERTKYKKKCEMVTVSGSFKERKNNGLRKHSGFIAIDLDGIENPNDAKQLISNDRYIYSAFISISGTGLCLIFKIDPEKHLEAFNGIAEYLYENYQLIVDQSGKNVARARYVSYDPFLLINSNALQFKKYPPKPKQFKESRIVYVQTDFDNIISQLHSRGINLTESYQDWVSICYALISKFGSEGKDYFHTISSVSGKYNAIDCDKQYDACLNNNDRSGGKSKIATIGTIYYLAKQAGIETYSSRTKEIIRATASQMKAGSTKEGVSAYLSKHHEIPIAESLPIIEAVITDNIQFSSESIVDDIQSYLGAYNLRRNAISRNIEMSGKPIDDTDINSMYIDLKSLNDKITKELFQAVLFSNRIHTYHPIRDFLSESINVDHRLPNLDLLIKSIKTDTREYDKWITKWLVALFAAYEGVYSPLTLVLVGEKQGTGKSHFFRYLLPKKLRSLYAESKMDEGKDDVILMTKKLIICDDEYGGKSKKEYTKLKDITSKEWINVREPYGRATVDLRRLSMFCGTSNITQILNDPTGNRRVIPIHVLDIDRQLYNSCDKDMLMHELYSLYKSGYDYTILKEDIDLLNLTTEQFKESTPEEELILTKLLPGNDYDGEWLSVTQIIQYLINDTKIQGLNNTRIGMILKKLGYAKEQKRINGSLYPIPAYKVMKRYNVVT